MQRYGQIEFQCYTRVDFNMTLSNNLFSNEGNPNVQTIDGETPLHIAVIWNRTLIVEMLLVCHRPTFRLC